MTRRRVMTGLLLGTALMAPLGCGTPESSLDLEEAAAASAAAAPEVADAGIEVVEPEPVRPAVEIPADWPSEIEAVYGRYWLYWEAFAAAHGPPAADPTYGPLEELSTSTNWASLRSQLQDFADDGVVLELPDGSVTAHLLRLPDAAVLTGAEGEELILQDCWIDDFVQRTVEGEVLAEAGEAKLMNVVMRVVDGEWRVDGVTRASSESDGVEQCAELMS